MIKRKLSDKELKLIADNPFKSLHELGLVVIPLKAKVVNQTVEIQKKLKLDV